ncbi:MAG: glycosyltransferase [Magnetococcales bacterium]|nr:glycosyltransferase [Magnetococcales bacterium]
MSRIRFICHDNPKPSGGIKVLYQHVEILCDNGFDAAILHFNPGFNLDWLDSTAPVIDATKNLELKPCDWIVIPEDDIQALESFANVACKRIVFCQGHFNIFKALKKKKTWKDYGINHVLASSTEIQSYIKMVFGIHANLIPLAINHGIFKPGLQKNPLAVAYMPRKGSWNLKLIISSFWHQYPQLREVEWIAIDNMSETQVAKVLQHASIFISTGYQEGFGLPPVEAMACGAIVVGFKGGGGKDYATESNGIWVNDEDPISLVKVLSDTLSQLKQQPHHPSFTNLRDQGFKTASRYNKERTKKELINIWRKLASLS